MIDMVTKPWLVPLWRSNDLLGISTLMVLIESDNLYIKGLDDFILQTITSRDHYDLYICVIEGIFSRLMKPVPTLNKYINHTHLSNNCKPFKGNISYHLSIVQSFAIASISSANKLKFQLIQ